MHSQLENDVERLIVLIPSTFTSNLKNRLIRTYVIGELARLLGIGRVTHVFVYYDRDPYFDSNALGRYITKILKYAVTPPWLKKKVFPLSKEDRYLGVIPPLQIHSHMHENGPLVWGDVSQIKKGQAKVEFRSSGRWASIQIETKELAKKGYQLKQNQLVLLDPKETELVSPYEISRNNYVGFYASYLNHGIHKAIRYARKLFPGIVVGTSKNGDIFSGQLSRHHKNVTLVFGGPNRGLHKIEGFVKSDFDMIINVMPYQETKTLRMEEALQISLVKLGFY